MSSVVLCDPISLAVFLSFFQRDPIFFFDIFQVAEIHQQCSNEWGIQASHLHFLEISKTASNKVFFPCDSLFKADQHANSKSTSYSLTAFSETFHRALSYSVSHHHCNALRTHITFPALSWTNSSCSDSYHHRLSQFAQLLLSNTEFFSFQFQLNPFAVIEMQQFFWT